MPQVKTTTNSWPRITCPVCGETFTTDDHEALDAMNGMLHCENEDCEAELVICNVEYEVTVVLKAKEKA